MCRVSTATRRFTRTASPWKDPDRFAHDVADACRTHGTRVLVPGHDDLAVLAGRRHLLPDNVSFVSPPAASLQIARSKLATARHAESHGVRAPVTHQPRTEHELRQLSATLDYPAVVKPRFGNERERRHGGERRSDAPEGPPGLAAGPWPGRRGVPTRAELRRRRTGGCLRSLPPRSGPGRLLRTVPHGQRRSARHQRASGEHLRTGPRRGRRAIARLPSMARRRAPRLPLDPGRRARSPRDQPSFLGCPRSRRAVGCRLPLAPLPVGPRR